MTADANEQGTVRYIRCVHCGSMNPASAPGCAHCGKPPQAATPPSPPPAKPAFNAPGGPSASEVTCPKCQKSFPAGSKFCGYCGSPLPVAAPIRVATPPPPAPAQQPRPMAPPASVAPPVPRPSPSVERPAAAPPSPLPPIPKPPAKLNIPESAMEGTVVFSGLRAVRRLEARITEKKPDGTWGKTVPITKETLIGREKCDLSYPADALLSRQHASIALREGKLVLKDLNSQNGSFIRQRHDTELVPGDVFLLGRELFRFVPQNQPAGGTAGWSVPQLQKGPLYARLEHINLSGEVVQQFNLDKAETILGRTTGDLIFKDDPYMSGTHARIVAAAGQPGRFILQDLRSRNGVYRRIRVETDLADGDEFFMGEQLFHVDLKVAE